MSSTSPKGLSRLIEQRTPDWIALLQALIRQRSTFEEEHGIVDLVCNWISAVGIEPIRVMHDPERLATLPAARAPFSKVPGRCSVVARLPGRGTGKSLAFNVHLDVVPEGDPGSWTRDPFGGVIDGDTIFGRGAADDKSGVAIALAVLEVLTTTPLSGDVIFHFVLEDETTGNGSLLCLEAGHGADAAVIIDGTRSDRAIEQHAGQFQFHLHVRGKPASVSVSHMGVNAADLLARLVARLADRVALLNQEREEPWTRFPSPFQLVTQRLASDSPVLTVPDRAEATCYATFPPPWTLSRFRDFLEREVRIFASERQIDVPILTEAFTAEPVRSDPRVFREALARAAAAEGFVNIEFGPSTGTSDLRHFAARGIPCVLYGPGAGFNPHRPDEHYRVPDLGRMVGVFVGLAMLWCGNTALPGGSDLDDSDRHSPLRSV